MIKPISFLSTFFIQLFILFFVKILDNLFEFIVFLTCCILIGFFIKVKKASTVKMKEIGWGVLYGSLTTLTLISSFLIWLVYNFPK